MKWKTKPRPQIGDIDRVLNFALTPAKLENGFTIWLEFYYAVYEYVEEADETLSGMPLRGWVCRKRVQK